MLPQVYTALDKLERYSDGGEKEKRVSGDEKGKKLKVKDYEGDGVGYWDDYCLTKFLEGVCLRYVAYPVGLSHFFSLEVELTWDLGPGCGDRSGRSGEHPKGRSGNQECRRVQVCV